MEERSKMNKEKKVLLTPNQLSMVRILMIPLFCVFFYVTTIPYNYFWSAVVFTVAALTDFLDGYVARKYNLVTDLGKFLDAIADKVLVLTAFVLMLTVNGMYGKYVWIGGVGVAIILARELIVSCFRMIAAKKGLVIAADMVGKIKTNFQDFAIVFLLVSVNFFGLAKVSEVLHIIGCVLFVIAVIMTVISGISYFVKNKGVLR